MCYARIENVRNGQVSRLFAHTRDSLTIKVEYWLLRIGNSPSRRAQHAHYRVMYFPA